MNEMKKVYLVVQEWHSNDKCPDNWYNNDEESVEGVFSTVEKAVDFIIGRLADQREKDILMEWESPLISIKMPTKEELLINRCFEWDGEWGGTFVLRYEETQLDCPIRKEG